MVQQPDANQKIGESLERLGVLFRNIDSPSQQAVMLETLIENIPDGIVVTDRRGHITYVNKSIAEILGYHPSELMDQYVGLIIAPEDREAHSKAFHNFVGGLQQDALARSGQGHGMALRKNGALVPVSSKIYGYFSGDEVLVIAFFSPVQR